MSQTTAPRREMVEARLGLIAEPFAPEDIRAKIQPDAKSYFGHLVVADGNEEKVKHPDADIADLRTIEGIVAATHAIESKRDDDVANYDEKETLNVLRKGYVWVAIEEDVAYGDPVFVRHTATGQQKQGAFRVSADSTNTTEITSIARWSKGGLAVDGIALLEINLI